jgi:single-stranded DNA-binding protein
LPWLSIDLFTEFSPPSTKLNYPPKGIAVVNASLANNELYTSEGGERQQITIQVDVNSWGKPAENFAMLANRGQKIFVEASLRQDK